MKIVKLKDVASITTGKTPSKSTNVYYSGGTVPFVKPPNLNGSDEIIEANEYLTNNGAMKANIIPKHSILVSCIGSLGKVGIAGIDLATNQQINSLTFNNNLVNYKYGYYFSLTLSKKLEQIANSAVVPIVNKTNFSNLDFILYPLDEQQRIVKILDQADNLRQKRKQIIKLFDEYLISFFYEKFGDPAKNPKHYEIKTINDIALKVTDGEHATPRRTETGIKLLSARNIKNGYIDFEAGVDYIPEDEYKRIIKRCNPQFGDLLISCSGTIGRVTTVNITEPFTLVRSAALIKPDRKQIDAKFLEYHLRTPYMQNLMNKSVNQSSQANLFLGYINKLPVLVPSLKEQNEFSMHVEQQEILRKKMIIQSKELENQFQALMQNFFSLN